MARFVLTVCEHDTRLAASDRGQPFEEILLASVGAETGKAVDLGADNDFFAVNADNGLTFEDTAAQRAAALESDNQDMSFGAPKIALEVMKDSTRVAHTRAGEDQATAFEVVDLHRIPGGRSGLEAGEIITKRTFADEFLHLIVEDLAVFGIDLCCFDRHRAIEKNGEGMSHFPAEHPAEKADEKLRSAHSKRGHENFSAITHRVLYDLNEFGDGLIEGPMVAVAVGGFEKDEIGVLEGFEVAEDGDADRA